MDIDSPYQVLNALVSTGAFPGVASALISPARGVAASQRKSAVRLRWIASGEVFSEQQDILFVRLFCSSTTRPVLRNCLQSLTDIFSSLIDDKWLTNDSNQSALPNGPIESGVRLFEIDQ